jgi:hypothetical protein
MCYKRSCGLVVIQAGRLKRLAQTGTGTELHVQNQEETGQDKTRQDKTRGCGRLEGLAITSGALTGLAEVRGAKPVLVPV